VDANDLSQTRAQVREWLGSLRLSENEVFDMTLACGEAIGNAVDHGCGCALVTLTAWPDRAIMEITDCGCGFDCAPGEVPAPEHGGLERGRGISLMRLLVDSVEISSRARGEGTLVRLTKMIS
jgi:anti-sigma regulatory factor (Ser/Thr protein kinase)